MSLRTEWNHQVPANDLITTCNQRSLYHSGRKQVWMDQKAEAEKALRETGIDIREYEQTGGQGAQAVLDPTLARRFAECQSKIKQHHAAANEYARWASFLAAHEGTVQLDAADHAYFQAKPEEAE
jgi:hypothetical protein